MRSLVICIPYPIFAGGKTGKNEMGGACGTYGGGDRCVQCSGGEALEKETIGEPRRSWDDNIKMDLQEMERVV